ncbi:MAG TPA: hypothetical protein V6D20_01300, partial [Candidatus Obscuribacterales bacterium]
RQLLSTRDDLAPAAKSMGLDRAIRAGINEFQSQLTPETTSDLESLATAIEESTFAKATVSKPMPEQERIAAVGNEITTVVDEADGFYIMYKWQLKHEDDRIADFNPPWVSDFLEELYATRQSHPDGHVHYLNHISQLGLKIDVGQGTTLVRLDLVNWMATWQANGQEMAATLLRVAMPQHSPTPQSALEQRAFVNEKDPGFHKWKLATPQGVHNLDKEISLAIDRMYYVSRLKRRRYDFLLYIVLPMKEMHKKDEMPRLMRVEFHSVRDPHHWYDWDLESEPKLKNFRRILTTSRKW